MSNQIEINHQKYERIPEKPKKPMSKAGMMLLAMSTMYGNPFNNYYTRKRPNIDIIKEFELIQQKKSNLSKNDRDWVENVFYSMYRPAQDK